MSLSAGARLGSYEVLAPLGAGGMGEVYRARDSKLGRDVAIKALPESFAADPDRLARFEREARLLASMSHANVAAIYGLEEIDRRRYLVLELVEGESLAHRLARGPLSVADTIDVGRQVAAALEAAHEGGIVHRDLKPGNVMLAPSGAVKVLDFGLAKSGTAVSSGSGTDLTNSPTIALSATAAGVVLGTAAYMSPEQARGKSVDRRTDIWSFGCVLYECLTGRQAFQGETVSDLVARILEREPDWGALPPATPARLRALIERCLRKDAKERLRDIGDARLELAEIAAGASGAIAAAPAPRPRRRWALDLLGPIAGAIAVVIATRLIGGTPPRPLHVSVQGPVGVTLSEDCTDTAISPDGRLIAFCAADSVGTTGLWLRPLGSMVSRELPGTEGAKQPFWSPDSRDLAFFAGGNLRRIGVSGDNVQLVCPAPNPRGGAWGRGDVIVFAPAATGPLMRVPASGGTPRPATTLDSTRHETAHRFPNFLPDGRHFLFVSLPGSNNDYDTWAGAADAKRGPRVCSGTSVATFAKPGYVIFTHQGTVFAQRFSTWTQKTSGAPRSLRDLRDITGAYTGAPIVSVSNDGLLVQPDVSIEDERIDVVDRAGHRVAGLALPRGIFIRPRVSPDGRALAVGYATNAADRVSPMVADLVRGASWRLPTASPTSLNPVWTADGRRIIFSADVADSRTFFERNADGSGPEDKIGSLTGLFNDANCVTPDGRTLIYRSLNGETNEDLWAMDLDAPHATRPLLHTVANELDAALSPDGRWLAYRSDESGQFEVYVQSYPSLDRKVRVSVDGTQNQVNARSILTSWRSDGRELYFVGRDGASVMAVDVTTGPAFTAGTPHLLFRTPPATLDIATSPDGQRFYLVLPNRSAGRPLMHVFMNWTTELEHPDR